VACIAVVAVAALRARAQDASSVSPNERALARQELDAGIAAARAGRWEDAHRSFARVYALVPTPSALLNLAGAQARTARLVAAAESYRRFLREALGPELESQRAAARAALAETQARTPHVRIRAEGLGPEDAVDVDGEPLSRASLGAPLPIDPGAHTARIRRGAVEVAHAEWSSAERDTREVRLRAPEERSPGRPPQSRAPARSAAITATPARDDDTEGSLLASPWLWIVTGVVIAAGAVSVGIAIDAGDAPEPYSGNLGRMEVE